MSITVITVNFDNKATTLHAAADTFFNSPNVTIKRVNIFLATVNLTWDDVDEVFVVRGLDNFRFTNEDNEGETIGDFERRIMTAIPNAVLEDDGCEEQAQIVIYTDLAVKNGRVVEMDE